MAFIWLALAVIACFVFFKNCEEEASSGPRGLTLLGNLHMFGENLYQDLNKIAKKHGPIMSIHFGLVHVIVASSPYLLEQFLEADDLTFSGGQSNEVPEVLFYNRRNAVSANYGPYRRNMRANCALSVASLNANMSCLMIFGKKYMVEYLGEKGFKALIQDILRIAGLPNIVEFFPFLCVLDLQGFTRHSKELGKLFDEFLERVMDEHVHDQFSHEQKDMMDTLTGIMLSGEAEFKFDRRRIKVILMVMFL
ncbi:unnamed protein product [Withania somnifera]